MSGMFSHVDARAEARALGSLFSESAAIAFHADADGFCAAFLGSRLSGSTPQMFQVFTEDLDLSSLDAWVRKEGIRSLVTFDINMLSAAGAMPKLAGRLAGRLRIYDDHLGLPAEVPKNVDAVSLLPPEDDNLPRIRPASLFCFEMLRSSESFEGMALAEFVAWAAAYGEGVARPFQRHLPRLDENLSSLARRVGWGINAYFTDMSIGGEDLTLMGELIDLANRVSFQGGRREILGDLVESSQFATRIFEADSIVSRLVDAESSKAAKSAPWLEVGELSVYLVDVDCPRRILHLVASATRTKLDHGVVISRQDTRSGVNLELRRARSLHEPDLAAVLLDLNPDWFVSRGGHPMAAGATVVPESANRVLDALRKRLES